MKTLIGELIQLSFEMKLVPGKHPDRQLPRTNLTTKTNPVSPLQSPSRPLENARGAYLHGGV